MFLLKNKDHFHKMLFGCHILAVIHAWLTSAWIHCDIQNKRTTNRYYDQHFCSSFFFFFSVPTHIPHTCPWANSCFHSFITCSTRQYSCNWIDIIAFQDNDIQNVILTLMDVFNHSLLYHASSVMKSTVRKVAKWFLTITFCVMQAQWWNPQWGRLQKTGVIGHSCWN